MDPYAKRDAIEKQLGARRKETAKQQVALESSAIVTAHESSLLAEPDSERGRAEKGSAIATGSAGAPGMTALTGTVRTSART